MCEGFVTDLRGRCHVFVKISLGVVKDLSRLRHGFVKDL